MEQKLMEFIKKEFLPAADLEITPDTKLISSGLIDSFALVALQRFIEKEFGKTIPPPRLRADSFDTVRQMLQAISRS